MSRSDLNPGSEISEPPSKLVPFSEDDAIKLIPFTATKLIPFTATRTV